MNKLLKEILEIQSTSYNQVDMQKYLYSKILGLNNSISITFDEEGNIYVTKGDAEYYPCVVAHMDTVHDIIDKDHYHVMELGGKVFAMDSSRLDFTGVGGDDKCGIYIALQCLIKYDNIKIAFFVDEEVGCQGSSKADLNFFKDVAYVIQCDRQGYKDVVTKIWNTELCSYEFQDSIEDLLTEYNKDFCPNGGMTDVYQLKLDGLEVSCLNLSCGYYRPHTDKEFISLKDLEDTREFVEGIIDTLGETQFYHKPVVLSPSWRNNVYYGYGSSRVEEDFDYNQHFKDTTDVEDTLNTDKTSGGKPTDIQLCPECGSEIHPDQYDEFVDACYCHVCRTYTC